MKRIEFSRKIKAQAFLRSGGSCETCGARLKTGEGEYDHILPCALGGEATLDNCKLICRVCHKEKTHKDVLGIRKADRVRDKHNGTFKKKRSSFGNSKFKRKLDGTVVNRETGEVV